MTERYDFIIIGGGVIGSAIGRELSRYVGRCLVLEKEHDVAIETSGRNSGVDHAGFYVPTGSLKAKLNIEGHKILPSLCEELGVPYEKTGKLVVAQEKEEIEYLEKLKEQGKRNGTPGLQIIGKEKIQKLEPKINAEYALYSPTSGILDPFQLNIGLAENAIENGCEYHLEEEVIDVVPKEKYFQVITGKNSYQCSYLINSAGLYADEISKMAGVDKYTIYPCRGEYHVLDKKIGRLLNMLVYPVPPKDSGGLGVHLTPTVDGNIMLGPSAQYIDDPCNVCNTEEIMDRLLEEARDILPEISMSDFIRSFAGIRPKLSPEGFEDFVVKEEYPGFINLVGIESPGLTAAPAIAEKVVGMIKEKRELEKKQDFQPYRDKVVRFSELSDEKKAELIEKDPRYGEIICRCETVTKKEIIDAINNRLGAKSINAIKRRSRASMGRCQGGFCWPRLVEILEEETGLSKEEIKLEGKGSEMFAGSTKDLRRHENEN